MSDETTSNDPNEQALAMFNRIADRHQQRVADAQESKKPTPLKGFIEVFPYKGVRVLIAVTAIAGIRDQGDKGCVITLSSAVMVHAFQETLFLEQPYAEIVALLAQAQ